MKIIKKIRGYRRAIRFLYRKMTLHSRVVFLLKIALPSITALFIGMVILVPVIDDKIKTIKISMPSLESTDKVSFDVDNASFYGQGENDTLFSVTVSNFKEDKQEQAVFFKQIKGKIFLKDGGWVDISTNDGDYKKSKNLFSMRGNISLLDSDKNEVYTEKADV